MLAKVLEARIVGGDPFISSGRRCLKATLHENLPLTLIWVLDLAIDAHGGHAGHIVPADVAEAMVAHPIAKVVAIDSEQIRHQFLAHSGGALGLLIDQVLPLPWIC